MSTTRSESKDVTLDEFESHRRNLRDEQGIVSDITPVSKDKIRVNVELSHGETEFSKTMETEDFNGFMVDNGIKQSRSSDAIVGKKVDVRYQNNKWQLDYCSSDEDNSIDHSFRVSLSKWINVISFIGLLISFIPALIVKSPSYLMFVVFAFLTHLIASLYYQSAVGVASESGSVDPSRRAVITDKAHQTYQKDSFTRRVLDSATMYISS